MSSRTICPKCATVIPSGVAEGLCPQCLLAGLLEPARPASFGESEEEVVGPYELVELLGEGGMGSVWRARQLHPVEREVALKIIRPGMDSREIVSRFEAERQSLAMMDHPGIARVYEAGATGSGRPYFAMELVEGTQLSDFCRTRHLPLEVRLRIFLAICEAVEHAHRKGILHRDLKPSNVLVVDTPGGPQPKVIDFGIARMLEAEGDGRTFVTRAGHAIGTPGYMSPEQAGAEPDVDTRSDVYSLGALLYEMLTGVPPLGRETFREVAYVEVMRLIRETDPPRPSTRVRPGSAPGQPQPPRIARDLDRIVMKALSRERERRYGGVTLLGEDVRRFLDHEPVSATDPTLAYRVGKFVRKHRVPVAFAGLLLLALLMASVLVTRESRRARAAAARERLARAETLGVLADAYRDNGLAASRANDAALAALWFTKAEATAGHDAERSRANRLRAKLHAARALAPVRKFPRRRQGGSRMFFDDSSRFLHEGWFGLRHHFFDLESGKELEFGDSLRAGCLLPGCQAAVSDGSSKVEVRDLATLEVLEEITLPEGKVGGVWADDSGSLLATGGKRLWIRDRRDDSWVGGPMEHPEPVRYARFSPDGGRLLTVDDAQEVRVFPVRGEGVASFGPTRVEGAAAYDFLLPDFYGGNDRIRLKGREGMRVFDVETGELVARLPHLDKAVDFTRSGDLFGAHNVVGETETGRVRLSQPFGGALFLEDDAGFYGTGTGELFDLVGRRCGRIAVAGHPFAFSPDGTLMATGHGAHLTVHQLVSPQPFLRITAPEAGRLALSPDQGLFASAGWSGRQSTGSVTRAYRVSDGLPAGPEIDTGFEHLSGTFLRGTTRLLTGGRPAGRKTQPDHAAPGRGLVRLWEATDGGAIAGPVELPGEPWAMLQHPTESWVAVICDDGSLLRLSDDLSGFERIVRLALPAFSGTDSRYRGILEFSGDGSRLYVSGFGSVVWAVDPEEKRIVFETAERHGPVLRLEERDGVLFSPTARSEDEWLFKATDGEVVALPRDVRPHLPLGSRISDDGQRLLLSGVTRVTVVDRATGAAVGPSFQAGTDWTSYSEFVKNRPWILTASTSKEDLAQLVLWDQRTGKALGPRWPLRGTALGDFTTTADGRRAILSIRGEGYLIVRLDEILAGEAWRDGLDESGRLALAELRAGRRLVDGSPVVLDTPDAWLPLWDELYGEHPELFPLKPDRETLLRWHRNRAAFLHQRNPPAAAWHRAQIDSLEENE